MLKDKCFTSEPKRANKPQFPFQSNWIYLANLNDFDQLLNPQAPAFIPGDHIPPPSSPAIQAPVFIPASPFFFAPVLAPVGQQPSQPPYPQSAREAPVQQRRAEPVRLAPVQQSRSSPAANGFVYRGRSRAQVMEDNAAEETRGAVERHIAAENWAPRGRPEQMFQVWDVDGNRDFYPLAVINSWGKEAGRWYWNADHTEVHFERRR